MDKKRFYVIIENLDADEFQGYDIEIFYYSPGIKLNWVYGVNYPSESLDEKLSIIGLYSDEKLSIMGLYSEDDCVSYISELEKRGYTMINLNDIPVLPTKVREM